MAIVALIGASSAWLKANAAQRQGGRIAAEIDVIKSSVATKESLSPGIREARQVALKAVEEAMAMNNRETRAAVDAAYRRGLDESQGSKP